MSTRLNAWTSALCVVAAIGVSLAAEPTSPAQAGAIPDRLTNQEFWQLVTTFEEKGGTYHSDNFTSNEPGLAQTAADVADRVKGGAYLGVGPEQNFSYIVAVRPTIAFVVDIRRQAIIQHLMFKALFELSADRVAFITRLFSRERPSGLDDAPIQKIWDAVPLGAGTDRDRYLKNRAEIETHLTKVRGIPLTTEDLASLEYVYNAFFTLGPAINYAGYQTRLTTGNVNFAKLSLAADRTGVLRSFLGSGAEFPVHQVPAGTQPHRARRGRHRRSTRRARYRRLRSGQRREGQRVLHLERRTIPLWRVDRARNGPQRRLEKLLRQSGDAAGRLDQRAHPRLQHPVPGVLRGR